MPKPLKTSSVSSKTPSPHRRPDQFGGAKKGIIVCLVCNNYFYKKSWHRDAKAFIAQKENKDIAVTALMCQADAMIKNKQYLGKVTIKNIPAAQKTDLINLINGFCERSSKRDLLARLIAITQNGSSAVVTLTENMMAQKMTKKIQDAFKTNTKIAYLREPGDVANITIEFLKK